MNPKTEVNLLEYFPNFFGIKRLGLETPNFKNLLILAGDCANFQGLVAGIIKLIKSSFHLHYEHGGFSIPTSLKQPLHRLPYHFRRQ